MPCARLWDTREKKTVMVELDKLAIPGQRCFELVSSHDRELQISAHDFLYNVYNEGLRGKVGQPKSVGNCPNITEMRIFYSEKHKIFLIYFVSLS